MTEVLLVFFFVWFTTYENIHTKLLKF